MLSNFFLRCDNSILKHNDFFLICDNSIYQIVKNENKLEIVYFCEIKKFKDNLVIDSMLSIRDLNRFGYLIYYCKSSHMFKFYKIINSESIDLFIKNNGEYNKLPELLKVNFSQDSEFYENLYQLKVPSCY